MVRRGGLEHSSEQIFEGDKVCKGKGSAESKQGQEESLVAKLPVRL